MKTVQIQLFQFSELNDKAKQHALKWYREVSQHDTFWHECVIDEAKEFGALMGLEIDQIHFTGFWSQGDGACFVGTWRARDVTRANIDALIANAPLDKTLHAIAEQFLKLATDYPFSHFTTTHCDRYCHENSVDYDFEVSEDDVAISDAKFQAFEKDMKEASRAFMRWIYTQLESDYKHEFSDENMAENIEANEYIFLTDGTRFDK